MDHRWGHIGHGPTGHQQNQGDLSRKGQACTSWCLRTEEKTASEQRGWRCICRGEGLHSKSLWQTHGSVNPRESQLSSPGRPREHRANQVSKSCVLSCASPSASEAVGEQLACGGVEEEDRRSTGLHPIALLSVSGLKQAQSARVNAKCVVLTVRCE